MHRMKGGLFETFVFAEVQALLSFYMPQARFYYLRTHDGLEIDGLIQHGSSLIPFEIKAAQTVTAEDAKPLRHWMTLSGQDGLAFVLYAGNRVQPIGRNTWAIPSHAVLE